MDTDETGIVVIGMGPGGEDAAGKLAQAGLHVTGVEARLVGGECPYWGCVPSKMMIRAANLLAEARRVPGMAGAATVGPDWARSELKPDQGKAGHVEHAPYRGLRALQRDVAVLDGLGDGLPAGDEAGQGRIARGECHGGAGGTARGADDLVAADGEFE